MSGTKADSLSPRPHPATGEPEYSMDELEFIRAVDAYKQRTGDRFPTNCTLLRIVKSLGYTKLKGE